MKRNLLIIGACAVLAFIASISAQNPLPGTGTGSSGSSSGGATAFAGLTDCKVTQATNVYSMAACSESFSGGRTAMAAASVTITGVGTSTAFQWLDQNGCNVGHNSGATFTMSNCTERTGVTAFPTLGNVTQLASWTYNAGTSTFGAPTDLRSAFARTEVANSDGSIDVSYSGGFIFLGLSNLMNFTSKTTIPNQTGVAATRTAIVTCVQGQTFLQTDGTKGIYQHQGANGACSWTAPVGGGGNTIINLPLGSLNSGGSWIPAGGWDATIAGANGVSFDTTGTTTGLALPDSTTTSISTSFLVPATPDWDGSTAWTYKVWSFPAGGGISDGQVALLRFGVACRADNSSLTAGTLTTTDVAVTYTTTANNNMQINTGTLTMPGSCPANTLATIRLQRIGADGTDTLNGTANTNYVQILMPK